MSLPVSGSISFNQINVELGRSGTASLNLNDSTVRSLFGQVSGVIDMNTGHGKSSVVTYNLTIAANTTDYNLHNALVTAGWDGTAVVNATVTINSGIIVGSTSTATYAFDTGVIPAGSTVNIVNNGYIVGRGGNGGNGGANKPYATAPGSGAPGQAGGPAMYLRYAVSITNGSGYIYSGGGGGGGGGVTNGANVGYNSGGGGGGGGAGNVVGAPGANGIGNPYVANGGGLSIGGGGGVGGGVIGGAGGALNMNGVYPSFNGGGGGGGGANGGHGGRAYTNFSGAGFAVGAGGVGGGHGAAITTNGNTVTYVSGNTRVYGGTV